MRRVLVITALAFSTLFVAVTPSSATSLVASDPQAHQELTVVPGWVSLAFDREVSTDQLKVLVLNSAGRNVTTGDPVYLGSSISVALENGLPKGTYTVSYQVSRTDGEPEGGSFQFAYGKGTWTKVTETWSGKSEQPPAMANPDPQATVPVPSGEPTATASATASAPDLSGTTPAVPSAAPSAGSGSGTSWWWIGGGILVAALAVAGGLWWWLRRSRGRHEA